MQLIAAINEVIVMYFNREGFTLNVHLALTKKEKVVAKIKPSKLAIA